VNDRRVQDDWESVLPISQRIINSEKLGSIGLNQPPSIKRAGRTSEQGSDQVSAVLSE